MTSAIPNAPTNLTATPNQNAQVPLSWTAPSYDGDSPIFDYVVQYGTQQGSWFTFSHPESTNTSITVKGLINGQTYYFQVAAANSIGTGPFSAIVSATPFIIPKSSNYGGVKNHPIPPAFKIGTFSTPIYSQYEIDFLREQYGDDMPLMLEGIHVADPELKNLIKTPEWSRAIIILLYDYYSTSKVPINRIREDADVNSIRERILSSYEITRNPEDLLPVKEVSDRLDETLRKISNELAGLGVVKKKPTGGCHKNVTCFVGIRRIIKEVTEECLDDV